ncbi:23S rRNA pseudouridine955/2504/2580 synthase [Bosea sp. OK403]|jgi:23S rRNA pseudouridine955/2504/2580 synthase|uniref:RluA family pseudouridine synthase n=1 Tax=Bosea sp. OK403 TaxID=1855286 RepID=UPI0008EEB211|nr:RluA family pseudouridine synthase [Bosea sp. OK403]SFJ81420.1 23S rRNA pseudouridine955/2504/2580 synthase [Bosea sp. OK403]
MRTGNKGPGGSKSGGPKGSGPKRGGRPPASGAPRGPAKGKRPSHDARRSARASARPRPEPEEGVVRTEPTRNPAPHHPVPRAAGPRKPAAPRKAPVTDAPTRAEVKAETAQVLATGVQQLVVTADENEMRIDRFLENRFPQLSFSHIQRIVRKGELRVNGKRADSKDRLEEGQTVRIPPLKLEPQEQRPRSLKADDDTLGFLRSITLYEDDDVIVLNKPAGLAVQGGSGTTRHVDQMLDAMMGKDGQKPRLVHRLDKDTAGCLVIAKSRFAAATLAKTFRSRSARKVYWALVAGVPRVRQGRISTYLAREEAYDGDQRMAVAKHGDDGAMHAVTYYAVVETAAQKLGWLSLKPVTGRTHQLRAHAAHIGHPIVGDPKYFNIKNWELPGGIQNKLHLLARRIVLPHPRGKGTIDVSAPLPPHMRQSWNLLGFEDERYDPIVDAPDE